jgi:lipid-binding SYLF domain-containing protein
MATTRQVWDGLRTVRNQVAARLGVDVTTSSKEARAMGNANLAMVAVVVKVLIDKGLITGAELQAAANAAASGADGSSWDDEPINPTAP